MAGKKCSYTMHVRDIMLKCMHCGNIDTVDIDINISCDTMLTYNMSFTKQCTKCNRGGFYNILSCNRFEAIILDIMRFKNYDTGNGLMAYKKTRYFPVGFSTDIYNSMKYLLPETWIFECHEDGLFYIHQYNSSVPPTVDSYSELINWVNDVLPKA